MESQLYHHHHNKRVVVDKNLKKTLPLDDDFAGREIRAIKNNEILTEHIKTELLGSLRIFEKAELEFLAGLETFTSHESIVSNVTTKRPESR